MKKNKVAFITGGNGGIGCRLSIPKAFLDKIGVTKKEPFVTLEETEKGILIKKAVIEDRK